MSTMTENGNGQKAERTREGRFVAPAVDIFENSEGLVLFADVPGVSKEGVTIELENQQLTLTAKRTGPEPTGQRVAGEFRAHDFHRTFVVSQDVDGEKITAEIKNGVLRVTLPRRSAARPRRINVQAAQ